ncbi:MAG: hypothetical protein K1X75_13470 [Leptospirales bacterium]|nr:hypothetical protein [Leptospirales bacterium]
MDRRPALAALLALSLFLLPGLSCTPAARPNPDPQPTPLHQRLSEYGLFQKAERGVLQPVSTAVAYDLNTPLFSDYALKYRTLHIPAGAQMQYADDTIFAMPVGTIITKTFSFPADFRRPQERVRRIETRLLIRQPTGWVAVPYVWNADQSDATQAAGGLTTPIDFIDADGNKVHFNYSVPSRNQCGSCHQIYEGRRQIIVPIGVRARNINRDFAYAEGVENTLQRLKRLQLLVGLPWFGIPAASNYADESQPVAERARDYLDANCAHCHRDNAAAGLNSKLILSHSENDASRLGLCKTPGSAGKGGGGLTYDIVPGHPELSILHYRMATDQPGAMMPQLGRALVHREAVALIARWIQAMPERNCP